MNTVTNLLYRGLVPQTSVECKKCKRIGESVYKDSDAEKHLADSGWTKEPDWLCPWCVRGLDPKNHPVI